MKQNADERRGACRKNCYEVGDLVLVLNNTRVDKTKSRWFPMPFVVAAVKGTSILVKRKEGGPTYLRNISHVKKYVLRDDGDQLPSNNSTTENADIDETESSNRNQDEIITAHSPRPERPRNPPDWYGDVVQH